MTVAFFSNQMRRLTLPLVFALAVFLSGCSSPTVINLDSGPAGFVSTGISALSVRLSSQALSGLGRLEAQAAQARLEAAAQTGLAGRNGLVASAGQRLELVVTDLKLRGQTGGLMLGGEHVRGQGRVYDSQERLMHTFMLDSASVGSTPDGSASALERVAQAVARGVFGASASLQAAPASNGLLVAATNLSTAQKAAVASEPKPAPEPEPAVALPVAARSSLAAVALPVIAEPPVPALSNLPPAAAPPPAAAERPLVLVTQRLTADAIVGLPAVTPEVVDEFRAWLDRRMPRAFALSGEGQGFGTHAFEALNPGEPLDAATRALANCRSASKTPCRLLAVDDRLIAGRSASAIRP